MVEYLAPGYVSRFFAESASGFEQQSVTCPMLVTLKFI